MSAPLTSRPRLLGWYARHGVGKSVLAAQAARWFHKEKGLRTRVVSLDPGSHDQYQDGISKGYVDYLPADGWTNFPPNVLYQRLAEGHWPEDPSVPGSPILPGYEQLRLCKKCGKDSGSRGAAHASKCQSCGVEFAAGQRLPVTRNLTSLEGVGLLIIEGITKVGDSLLEACRQSRPGDRFWVAASAEGQEIARAANDALKKKDNKDRSKEEQAAVKVAEEAASRGELSLATTAEMGHYFKAGQDLIATLAASNRIPIPMVIWTAHEGRWEEKLDKTNPNSPLKLLGLGPQMVPAKNMRSGLRDFVLFGHLTVEEGGKRVMWLQPHKAAGENMPWEAKANIVGLPPKVELPDPQKANGFGELMRLIEKAGEVELP